MRSLTGAAHSANKRPITCVVDMDVHPNSRLLRPGPVKRSGLWGRNGFHRLDILALLLLGRAALSLL